MVVINHQSQWNYYTITIIIIVITTTAIIIKIKMMNNDLMLRQPHLQLPPMQGMEQGGVRLHRCGCNLSWSGG